MVFVGHTYKFGKQPQFGVYGSYEPVGFTGFPPLWQQPGRYPISEFNKAETSALSAEYVSAVENDPISHLGPPAIPYSTPILLNGQGMAAPVIAQTIMFTPRASSHYASTNIASMNIFG